MLHRLLYSLQQTAAYYTVIAGAFFALWLWWRKRPGTRKPLQAAPVPASQIRRELATSIGSIIVFSSYLPILFLFGFGQYTQYYPRIADHGWPYFFLSILLADRAGYLLLLDAPADASTSPVPLATGWGAGLIPRPRITSTTPRRAITSAGTSCSGTA